MARILVVDDQAANRRLVRAVLGLEGHDVLEATDGVEGLAIARTERPALILTDVLMPSMDGYEFVRQLRADVQVSDTPVIFFTAHYLEGEAQQLARTCQVMRVLSKPCEASEMLSAVAYALSDAASADQRELTRAFS